MLFSRTLILSLAMGAVIMQANVRKRGPASKRVFSAFRAVGLVQFLKILNQPLLYEEEENPLFS